jgi:hypothetical protein
MDAWVLAFTAAVSLVFLAIFIRTKGVTYATIGGIVSLWGLARLLGDKALVIGHECCNAGADVTVSLGSNDLITAEGIMAVFTIMFFVLAIMEQMKRPLEMS